MEFKSKLFAILAVFCVILSVCAVSAVHVSDYDNDYYLDGSHDGHDGLIIPPDFNHDEAHQHAAGGDIDDNETNSTDGDIYDNGVPYHGDGTIPTGDIPDDDANATTNSTNATPTTQAHTMHATGNPVLLLLGGCALIGGCAVIRRK